MKKAGICAGLVLCLLLAGCARPAAPAVTDQPEPTPPPSGSAPVQETVERVEPGQLEPPEADFAVESLWAAEAFGQDGRAVLRLGTDTAGTVPMELFLCQTQLPDPEVWPEPVLYTSHYTGSGHLEGVIYSVRLVSESGNSALSGQLRLEGDKAVFYPADHTEDDADLPTALPECFVRVPAEEWTDVWGQMPFFAGEIWSAVSQRTTEAQLTEVSGQPLETVREPAGTASAWGERSVSTDGLAELGVGEVRWVCNDDFSWALLIDRENTLWLWYPGSYLDHSYSNFGRHGAGPTPVMTDVAMAYEWTNFSDWAVCMALRLDGTVWIWGKDENGCLGLGRDRTDLLIYDCVSPYTGPQQVMDNVVFITMGGGACYAIDRDGCLWGWGDIGIPDENGDTRRFTPTPILEDVAYVHRELAVKTDGSLWTWGVTDREWNAAADLTPGRGEPRQLLSGGVAMAACWYRFNRGMPLCLILREDGTLWVMNSWVEDGELVLDEAPMWTMEDVYAMDTDGVDGILIVKENGELWEIPYPYKLLSAEYIEENIRLDLDAVWLPV